ncbi:hypothetical protein FRB95_001388 [Tulasnella sp. JGI-2019a]|nr:hypothetical protein FRB95_001388 [Tulasnella sp. JGI-2019a]
MLETLRIEKVPQHLTHNILAGINIPKRTSICIIYEQSLDSNLGLFSDPALAHFTSVLVASFRASLRVTILWGDYGKTMGVSSSACTMELPVCGPGNWGNKIPAGLSNALEVTETSEIHLGFTRGNSPSIILPHLHSSQSRITWLSMYKNHADEVTGMVQFLAEPTKIDSVVQWPLSRLKDIHAAYSELNRGGFMEAILKSSRYGGVGDDKQEEMNGVGVPEPCVRLHLTVKESLVIPGQTMHIGVEGGEELRRVLAIRDLHAS